MDLPLYLKNRMANRQLSHAYLVVGENRRELAQTLAAAWVCTGDKPPCGQCSGCRKAAAGIHPDIIRADPDGDGLKAEAVRALRSDAYIRPNEAPKKVYVLEHAELLNATGQNILLKLIEETEQANQDGQTLADLILTGAGPMESLPFLMSLEKKDRQEIALLLQAAKENLVAALPQRPDLLPVIDRLAPISAACEFNISAGHLSGWIAAVLS